jgi:hypothetical protein
VSTNDGGPAFPVNDLVGAGIRPIDVNPKGAPGCGGMTLRDYFATKALQAALIAGHDAEMRGHDGWRDELAREAYRFADAMLVARAKAQP